jgi:hypothetical protein
MLEVKADVPSEDSLYATFKRYEHNVRYRRQKCRAGCVQRPLCKAIADHTDMTSDGRHTQPFRPFRADEALLPK